MGGNEFPSIKLRCHQVVMGGWRERLNRCTDGYSAEGPGRRVSGWMSGRTDGRRAEEGTVEDGLGGGMGDQREGQTAGRLMTDMRAAEDI